MSMSIKMNSIISYINRLLVVYFLILLLTPFYLDNIFASSEDSSDAKESSIDSHPTNDSSDISNTDTDSESIPNTSSEIEPNLETDKIETPSSCILNRIDIHEGAKTDKDWILRFLQLKPNMIFNTKDIPRLKSKLLTTQVFYEAEIHMEYQPQSSDLMIDSNGKESKSRNQPYCNMFIELSEKWTLIPVIRGSIGGGTPLIVYGMYDTHSFGRLLTLGGEVHTYGSSEPGGVLWMKFPKWIDGNYMLSFQLWKQNIDSTSFDLDQNEIGTLTTQWSGARVTFLLPIIKTKDNSVFQTGFDYFIKQYKKQIYSPNLDYLPYYLDQYVLLYDSPTTTSNLRFKLLYDNVSIDKNLFDGLRVDSSLGGLFDKIIDKKSALNFDTEVYYYKLFPKDFNLATHLKFGFSGSKYFSNMTSLGGFDSIRGYKDGFMYGNKYGYLNLELRKILYKTQLIHLQGVLFSDIGTASLSSKDLVSNFEFSYGLGLKILVPSVYRMIFRFDYAIGRHGNQGLAIGTADFFDAYRPL